MKMTLLALGICCVLGQPVVAHAQSIAEVPPLALSKTFKSKYPVQNYWVSEKLDGARAFWNGRQLLSRRGNLFHAPAWFVQNLPKQPLDGELWLGRGKFEALMHVVRDKVPDESAWQEVRFHVFDLPQHEGVFEQRQAQLQKLVNGSENSYIKLVQQQRVASSGELESVLQTVLAKGGEGLMLQQSDLPYQAGRHNGLLKLKPYTDDEATVVEYLPGKGKYQGMVGALLVKDTTGRRFRLGSGLSDHQRKAPPVIGSQVSYRFQGRTGSGLPRFARFLRERPSE